MATIAVARDTVTQYKHALTVTLLGQDKDANTSRIGYEYTVESTGSFANGSWTTLNSVTFHAIINGVDHADNPNFDFRVRKKQTMLSGTQVISHDPDGDKSINIRLTCNALPTSVLFFAADSGVVSMPLTSIPRSSEFTVVPNPVYDGGSVDIAITRTDPTYTHTITWESGVSSGTIGTGVSTSASWAPSSSLLTGVTSTGITIEVTTFDGATQVGDPTSEDITFRVPPSYPEVNTGTPYDLRFRRVALVSGDLVPAEVIPFLTANTSDTYSAAGSCTLTVANAIYPTNLDEAVVLAEYYDGAQWLDHSMPFVLTRTETSSTEMAEISSYSGVSYLDFLLARAVVSTEPKNDTDTPGYFLDKYFDAAKNRGWGTHVVNSFTPTRTTSNTKWKYPTTQDISRNTPLSQLLDGFVSDILVEYGSHFDSDTGEVVFDVFNPGHGSDWTKTGADPIVNMSTAARFKVLSAAPVRKDFSKKTTRVFVRGDETGVSRSKDAAVNPMFGHLEIAVSATGVKTTSRLNSLGDAILSSQSSATVERTFSYDLSSPETPSTLFPYRTFAPGDWVLVPDGDGLLRVRVVQVAISRDADGTTATITVGELIPGGLSATARKLAQNSSGASSGGTMGSPLELSSAIPAAPLAVAAVSAGFWDSSGAPKSGVAVSWQEVTTSLSLTSLAVDQYEVWTRPEVGAPWLLASLTDTTDATLSPLGINASIDIQVRARSVAGNFGDYSDVITVVTEEPSETLAAPSTPFLEVDALGTVSVTWNGLIGGTTPPLWFNYAQVEISDAEAGAYSLAGQQLRSQGAILVPNVGAGTWWFRLVGYDTLNVRGTASSAASIVVVPLVIDSRVPEAPTGVTVASDGYWNGSTAESAVTVTWSAVTTGVDTDPIDILQYEVSGKLSTESVWRTLGFTSSLSMEIRPVSPLDATLDVRVRVQGENRVFSAYSTEHDTVITGPVMSMLPPTAPSLNSTSGVLLVDWDGLLIDTSGSDDADGAVTYPAPPYLTNVDIQISVDEGTTWLVVGFLASGDRTQSVSGIGVGSSVQVRLVAYDVLGRPSAPSNVSELVVTGINGADILAGTVNANRIVAGSIGVNLVEPGFGTDLDIAANGTVSIISGQAADAQSAADASAVGLAELRTRYDFTPSEAIISQPGSPFQVAISNTQMEFRESGVARAYLNAGVFNAPRMASGQLVLQYLVIENDPTGTAMRRI